MKDATRRGFCPRTRHTNSVRHLDMRFNPIPTRILLPTGVGGIDGDMTEKGTHGDMVTSYAVRDVTNKCDNRIRMALGMSLHVPTSLVSTVPLAH